MAELTETTTETEQSREGHTEAEYREEAANQDLDFLRETAERWKPAYQERKCDSCGKMFDIDVLIEIYFHNLETQYFFHSEKELLLWANSKTDDDSEDIEGDEQEEIEEADDFDYNTGLRRGEKMPTKEEVLAEAGLLRAEAGEN